MGAKFRFAVAITALLALTAVAVAGAATHKPRCKPASAARCLRLARGHEPVLVSSRGRISRSDALQAFVQTIGPLPGVKRLPGAVDRSALSSASGALRWAAAYLPTMTPAQRAAFKKLISGRPGVVLARIASNQTKAAKKKWEQAAKTVVPLLSQHLGVSLSSAPALPVDVKLMTSPDPDGPGSQAAAVPLDKNGNWASSLGPGVHCQIQVFPLGWQSTNPDLPIYVTAHEATHCFQFKLNSPVYSTLAQSPWLIEGGAEWAGDQVAREVLGHDPHDQYLTDYWNTYLTSPATPLFSRVYDAVGFFAHLAETIPGGNLWPTLREMFKANGSQAAYDVGVPNSNTAFLDSWASGYARSPSLGPGWDTTGIGITSKKPAIPFYSGGSASLDAGPRASAIARVAVGGQVLVVATSGGTPFGRLRDSSGTEFDLGSAAYCVSGQDCTCPSGSPGFGDTLPEIASGPAWVALSGSDSSSHVALTRSTVASWCQHPVGGISGGVSHIVVSGAASATSFQNGHNDSCTVHQSSPYPPGVNFSCFFEMVEPGGQITQVSLTTFHYTGPGDYHVDSRGTTTGPDVGYADLAASYVATWNPPPDQFDAGGFTISSASGGTISGSISATMGDVSQPEDSAATVSAGGTFTVPVQIVP
ncbi:MAG TPA: hypothetical protein VGH24_01545 [Solirubrobacteraceae bacterium]